MDIKKVTRARDTKHGLRGHLSDKDQILDVKGWTGGIAEIE